jgi:hypothetical protein
MVGNVLSAAESALNLEQGRLQKFKEIDERNQALRLTYNKVLLGSTDIKFSNIGMYVFHKFIDAWIVLFVD